MACGYFTCTRNALISLNILYILVAVLLIGVASYAKAISLIDSFTIIGAVIGCGVFLALIAFMGLVGAVKHHQICLFFYMVVLFLLFLIQFSIAIALLAFTKETQTELVHKAWKIASNETKLNMMNVAECCGFNTWNSTDDGPYCSESSKLHCCRDHSSDACCGGVATNTKCHCNSCKEQVQIYLNAACKITGGVGLFISFTEMFGVVLTVRYRGQRDPYLNAKLYL